MDLKFQFDRIYLLFIYLVVCILCSIIVSSVPGFMFLTGHVMIDNELAPEGTSIDFYINDILVGNTIVDNNGEYFITISASDDYYPINITINGYQAQQTIDYNPLSENITLDISIVNPKYYMFIAYNGFEGYNGNLGGIEGADAICNSDVPIFEKFRPTAGTYKAYISINGNYPGNTLGLNLDYPIYRTSVNGFEAPKKIAENLLELENGNLKNSILPWGGTYIDVWTGIKISRTEERDCNDWTTNENNWGYYGNLDSNTVDGDWAGFGFWSYCSQKKGIYCIGPVDIEVKGYCGDGIIEGEEECDDGNFNVNDNCVNCQNAECGDGYVSTTEGCDDGNNISRDGCENDCTITGYFMFVTSSVYDGNLNGVKGANEKCNSDVNKLDSEKMNGTYRAYIKTCIGYLCHPDLGLTNASYPIYRSIDEKKVANNLADLQDGTAILPITDSIQSAWIGGGGGIDYDCTDWTTNVYPPVDVAHQGCIIDAHTTKINGCSGFARCSEKLSLICIGPFDSSPIDVKVNIPEGKSFSSRILEISVETDFDTDYCTYELNNGINGDLDFVNGNLFIKTIDMQQDGSYRLDVICYIAAQPERTTSVARNFYVDSVPPLLISYSPEGSVYSKNVLIKMEFSEVINLDYLKIDSIDYTSSTTLKNTGDILSGFGELTISKTFGDSGNHIVKIRVEDMAGHLLETEFSFNVDIFGKVSGYVFDEYGAIISDADINVENVETKETSNFKSDSDGRYNIELIEGNYTINISKYGYRDISFSIGIDGKSDIKQDIILYKPDVAVQNLFISNNLVDGQNLSITADLSNEGSYDLNGVNYELYVNNILKETKIINLSSHSSKIIDFNLKAEVGEQIIKINATIPGTEINLVNNFVQKKVIIEPFNVLLDNITIYKAPGFDATNRVQNWNKFVISTNIRNLGAYPIYNIPAEFKITKSIDYTPYFNLNNEYGYETGNPKMINVTSGGTSYIEWLVSATPPTPPGLGNYYIMVSVDNKISTNTKMLTIE